jgi:hypothetical protein
MEEDPDVLEPSLDKPYHCTVRGGWVGAWNRTGDWEQLVREEPLDLEYSEAEVKAAARQVQNLDAALEYSAGVAEYAPGPSNYNTEEHAAGFAKLVGQQVQARAVLTRDALRTGWTRAEDKARRLDAALRDLELRSGMERDESIIQGLVRLPEKRKRLSHRGCLVSSGLITMRQVWGSQAADLSRDYTDCGPNPSGYCSA